MNINWFYGLFILLGVNLFVGIIFYFVNTKGEFNAKDFSITLLQSIVLIPVGVIYYYKAKENRKLAVALETQLQQCLNKNKVEEKNLYGTVEVDGYRYNQEKK